MDKRKELIETVKQAADFIQKAEKILDAKKEYWMHNNAADRGALNRQSMELTRSLAKYRKTGSY